MRRQTCCDRERERGAGGDGKETPRVRGALCARRHSQKETEMRPSVKGGEGAHAAEMDRHYAEETHIPRKTKTHPGTETLVHQKTHSETATEKQSKGRGRATDTGRGVQTKAEETLRKRDRDMNTVRDEEREREKSTDTHRQRERAVREKYSLKDRQRGVLPKGEMEGWVDGWDG